MNLYTNPNRHAPSCDRLGRNASDGYVYVAVLFTTLIVMATVAASLSISTANLSSQANRGRRIEALQMAESEIHRLTAEMQTSGQWRTNASNDQFTGWRDWTVGTATGSVREVRHRFHDPDGSLDDDDRDSVELTVHARIDETESAVMVRLEPDPQPLGLLAYAVTASDDLEFESGGTLVTERSVQVFDDCKTNSSGLLVTPRLECNGLVQMSLRGDLAIASVATPTYSVIDRYKVAGTQILATSVPISGGEYLIEDVVLSPNSNPFGSNDAAGIYWLNAGDQTVRINHCRLDATLVIENAAEIFLSGGINWSYPDSAEAILVSDAPITLQNVESHLSESDRGVNFNPYGSPYRETLSNGTNTDIYPTELRGFVYSTHNIKIESLVADATLPIVGSVLGRDVIIEGRVTVRHLDEWMETPPIGFADRVPMRFVRGTMRRIASP